MAFSSVEIKNLLDTSINDESLLIIEQDLFTGKTKAVDAKSYFNTDLLTQIAANTYYADETTITLDPVTKTFSIKPGSIDATYLDPSISIGGGGGGGGGGGSSLTGDLKTYTDPVTATGEFLEILINIGSATKKYAIRLYDIPTP